MLLSRSKNVLKTVNLLRAIHCNSLEKVIDVHPAITHALQYKQPIVALESTIITHGMPYPQNFQTACEVEELVKANGAQPATIAIIDGRVKVGLATMELEKLATKQQENKVLKCSRRDLAYVAAKRLSGGTTVAATMIIAHMAGLRVFATGGVGGVHREGHITLDISADLVELGRTPVAVVCSGVKSILDIPRTLEYLETQGVCVATFGNADGRFPDFYTRESGCHVPYNLRNAAEAASLIKAMYELQLKSGILIGVPIPEEFAADKQSIEAAIKQAYLEAEEACVSGKQITPFLLAAIAKITKGDSLKSNIALIKNNAAVGAQIAKELCRLEEHNIVEMPAIQSSTQQQKVPFIIGASILDLSLTMVDDMPTILDGATYYTEAKQSAGGVGRNLAEGIFKLHGAVNFVSVVGDDHMGQSLLQLMPQPLQQSMQKVANNATSLCSVIFDNKGDCKLILGNMEIHRRITPELVQQKEHLLRNAPIVVMDANLSLQTIERVLQLAKQHNRPVFFEPTDMRISAKPFTLPQQLTRQIKIISPNFYELKTIVECLTQNPAAEQSCNLSKLSTIEILHATIALLAQIQQHFDCILVTLGEHGVLVSLRADVVNKPLFNAHSGLYVFDSDSACGKHVLSFYTAPKIHNIRNVSGAGDSFSSAFITGLLRSYDMERCVALGFVAARRALQTEAAVPASYFADKNEESHLVSEALQSLQKQHLENIDTTLLQSSGTTLQDKFA